MVHLHDAVQVLLGTIFSFTLYLSLHQLIFFQRKNPTDTSILMQTDLKKLLRNPPLVKTPKIHDLINANPLLGALPPAVRDHLVGSTKETMKLRGVTLYKEGSKPNGIWLIANGVVKVIYNKNLHGNRA